MLSQKMLISARQKDETSKLMVHTIERRNEMNVNIFEVPVIDEKWNGQHYLHRAVLTSAVLVKTCVCKAALIRAGSQTWFQSMLWSDFFRASSFPFLASATHLSVTHLRHLRWLVTRHFEDRKSRRGIASFWTSQIKYIVAAVDHLI